LRKACRRQILSPLDLARQSGGSDGDIFTARDAEPVVLGTASSARDYRGPRKGFICHAQRRASRRAASP